MGVSTLDMVQFHWWDYRDVHYFDSMKLVYTLKLECKIKELGLTNFDTLHMAKLYEECTIPIVSNQVAYSIIDRRPAKKMVAWCLEHNVKILAYGHVFPYQTQLQLFEDHGCGLYFPKMSTST